eukprot:8234902-Pyramimonas_sp.AAC.1
MIELAEMLDGEIHQYFCSMCTTSFFQRNVFGLSQTPAPALRHLCLVTWFGLSWACESERGNDSLGCWNAIVSAM